MVNSDANPSFDDFLELDLLGPANEDMFSLFFDNDDLNAQQDLNSALLSLDDPLDLSTLNSLASIDTVDTPVVTEHSGDISDISATTTDNTNVAEQHDIQLLLAMNRKLQEQLRQQQQQQGGNKAQTSTAVQQMSTPISATTATASLDNSAMLAELTAACTNSAIPQALTPTATPALPLTPTSPATSPFSIATEVAAATADAQIAILLDSSKSAAAAAAASAVATTPVAVATAAVVPVAAPTSPAIKRPSPEPSPAPRKIAKTESTKTSRLASAKSAETTASLINTTLSAATLQFLLQQQAQMPLVPQLFTGKLTRQQIEETLEQLLESTKHLLLASREAAAGDLKEESSEAQSDEEMEETEDAEKSDEQQVEGKTHGLKTQPGIKTDDIPSSKDLKKMTSKERRQLRNKISARNFRVRRKEYIGQLEGQVEQHKTEARHLREAVVVVQSENKRLKEELEEIKRQLTQSTIAAASSTIAPQQSLTTSSPAPASLSSDNQALLASILTRSAFNSNGKNITLSMPRPQTPILTLNLKKDVPNSSSINASSWKDKNPVLVHTTLIPEISMSDRFQFGPKKPWCRDDEMYDRPWMNTEKTRNEFSQINRNPILLSAVVYELMKTVAGATLNTMSLSDFESVSTALVQEDAKADVQDYEGDRRLSEALEWEMQRDLWAHVQVMASTARFHDESKGELPDDLFQVVFGMNLVPFSAYRSSTAALASSHGVQDDPSMMEW
ncbi:hypothetical protein EDD11_010093, partial [Mortierella claussenii]